VLRPVHGAVRVQVCLRAPPCWSKLLHQSQQVQVLLLEDLSSLGELEYEKIPRGR
jgi:hypothetical protein